MIAEKLWIHELVLKELGGIGKRGKLLVTQHHIAHAASAFYPSPYNEAIIITVDGVGEWETTTIGIGKGNKISIMETIRYPHSLGLLYSAFTYFCGFKVNFGDYKFMGLAPYGEPIYYELIKREIIDIKEDGSFRLHLKYFDFYCGKTMINEKFERLFGGKRREPETLITKREMDIAASVQKVTEEILLKMVWHAKEKYGQETDNLVLAGGVALNCVANGRLLAEQIFKNIWVQPAAGDSGGGLGAALYAYYTLYHGRRVCMKDQDSMKGTYLGPQYSMKEIETFLVTYGYPYVKYSDNELFDKIADMLDEQKIIGLLQGRMEYGPRALGNRSIIADPRAKDMQSRLNLKIKYRESFRPFAPSVLEEKVKDYFLIKQKSPYMLLVGKVDEELRESFDIRNEMNHAEFDMIKVINTSRSKIPAVTHVDYSARIQTVSREQNNRYYQILRAFEEKTGCAVVVNTSFNVRSEPIVMTPEDAYQCFMRTDMDILILENCVLVKEEQPVWLERNWMSQYELD